VALKFAPRVKETSTTTGTGTYTLAGAVTKFQTFAAIGDGNTCYYAVTDDSSNDWEEGLGTYTAAGTTLARTAILRSSNSNNAVSWPAGTRTIFVAIPADVNGSLRIGVQPSFRVRRTSNQTITHNTDATVVFDASDEASTGLSYDTGTGIMTFGAGTGGLWIFTIYSSWDSNATGLRIASLARNGTTAFLNDRRPGNSASENDQSSVFHVRVADSDTLRVRVYQSSGGDLAYQGGASTAVSASQWWGVKVSD